MRIASVATLLIGLVLITVSMFWARLVPPPAEMPEELTATYQKAVTDAHAAGRRPDEAISGEAKKIRDEIEARNQRYERTVSVGRRVLQVLGVVCAVAGVGIYLWKGQE